LGFFNQAVQCFRDILSAKSDLAISVELSGVLMQQGCISAGMEMLTKAMDEFQDHEDKIANASLIASAQMSQAIMTAYVTGRFSPVTELVVGLYNDHLRDLSVDMFKKRTVSHVYIEM
jgi:hypothetical protein